MKKFNKVLIEEPQYDYELEEIQCDRCGKQAKGFDEVMWSDITTINIQYTFGSNKDGDRWSMDLCDKCIEEITESFKDNIKKEETY